MSLDETEFAQCRVIIGNSEHQLALLPEKVFDTCITSPPYYGQRDYGHNEQIGLEESPQQYIDRLVKVFSGVRRVLKDSGTLWVNIADTYASNWGMGAIGRKSSWMSSKSGPDEGRGWGVKTAIKPNLFRKGRTDHIKVKDLMGIPWRLAFALQADGWYLRQDIIWNKPNSSEMGVRGLKERCVKSHEYFFLLTKKQQYYFDAESIKEGDSKKTFKKSVWNVPTVGFDGAHFATFPPGLIEPAIKAGSPIGGNVLDPFGGAGTTGLVAKLLGRNCTMIELNPEYAQIAIERLNINSGL